MYCQKCGMANPDSNQFCGVCGKPLKNIDDTTQNTTQNNPVTTLEKKWEKEKRITELELLIKDRKEIIRNTEGNGWPLILGVIGLVLAIAIIGILIIIVAIFWAWDRSTKNSRARTELLQFESELSHLQMI